MSTPSLKAAFVGGIAGAVMAVGTVAVAGTGIGGVFNLGADNTVNGQTQLRGNTGGNPQLRVNNQQGTDAAIGMLGLHSAASGNGAGVQGESASTSGGASGVSGRMTSANAAVNSAAVRGVNSGKGFGVYGSSEAGGAGVYGMSSSGPGVHGKGSSGVFGEGSQYGVWAATGSSEGSGVYGQSAFNSGVFGAGVRGAHSGPNTGPGVMGETNSASPGATGILALASATNPGRDAVALRGVNFSTNQYGMGVWGSVNGAGWGVLGEAGKNGIGVVGKLAGAGTGVHGEAGTNGVGVKGVNRGGVGSYAGQFIGEVDLQGYLKLPMSFNHAPPSSDCVYNFHRGRIAVTSDDVGTLSLYVCGPAGWRYSKLTDSP